MTATAPETAAILTMPRVCERIGYPLDKLRNVAKRRPEVAALFSVRLGPARGIPAGRLPELRAALNLPPE